MKILLTIIAFLYTITGTIAMLGYIPTIKDLLKGTASANIHSYIIWAFSSFISFLYVLLVVPDLLLEIMNGLNFIFCTTILILALKLKK